MTYTAYKRKRTQNNHITLTMALSFADTVYDIMREYRKYLEEDEPDSPDLVVCIRTMEEMAEQYKGGAPGTVLITGNG